MSASRTAATPPSIDDLIERRRIVTHFQPILSARQRSVVGLEALTRGVPEGAAVIDPKSLFAMAAERGLTAELEAACCGLAATRFANLPSREPDWLLFVNLSLSAARDRTAMATRFRDTVSHAGLRPGQIAVEILEAEIADMRQLCSLVDRFREAGFLLALDDVGAGHSNLNRIPLIRPDILKVDRSLIAGIADDYYKQETLKSLVGLSRRIGALVVAEGIESEEEAMVALELGADLLQGYFLALPADTTANHLSDAAARIGELAERFKRYMVRTINDRKSEHRRCQLVMNQMLCQLAGEGAERFDDILRTAADEYADVECVYVLNEHGTQVTDTIGRSRNVLRAGVLFHPALRGADHSLKEYYYVLLGAELPQFTSEPYVSLASGSIGRTVSTCFRDSDQRLFVLCVDVIRG